MNQLVVGYHPRPGLPNQENKGISGRYSKGPRGGRLYIPLYAAGWLCDGGWVVTPSEMEMLGP